jgi:hypothetical protein
VHKIFLNYWLRTVIARQQPEEKKLITAMIEELSSNLAMDFDPSPAFERGLGGQSRPKQSRDFLVAGSSNASKLAAVL